MPSTARSGKRELLAREMLQAGVFRLLSHLPARNNLVVLNYHRIGNAEATPYDPTVFSATVADFRGHMELVSRNCRPIDLPGAIRLLRGEQAGMPRQSSVLITFDDGYLDNYELAFPILREMGIPATFFLPTGFIGTGQVPWWDAIAYMLKKTPVRRFELNYPRAECFDMDKHGLGPVFQQILALRKLPEVKDPEAFLAALESACETSRPDAGTERCFLNWDEARTMIASGMTLGAHTHSHDVLSQLSRSQQANEVLLSRDRITQETGAAPTAFAYPVGWHDSFTSETKQEVAAAGFALAFSFYGGVNRLPATDPFDIARVGIGSQSLTRLRIQLQMAITCNHFWP